MRLTYIDHPFLIDQISKDGKHMDCKEQTGNYGKDLIEEAIEKLWEYENLGEPNTIEALRQENEQLKTERHNDGLYDDRLSRLIDANEQLQAQNGAMRAALEQAESRLKVIEQATEYIKPNTGVWHTVGIALDEIHEAIAAIDKIGGREDV